VIKKESNFDLKEAFVMTLCEFSERLPKKNNPPVMEFVIVIKLFE